jgi:hypothetical protein
MSPLGSRWWEAAVFELKLLSTSGIPGALAKAERYRLLNQPWEAECIYRDVLDVESSNQDAVIGLVLAITDQFESGLRDGVAKARAVLPRIENDYQRAYYAGIICERRAKFLLHGARPGAAGMAHDLLAEARDWYAKAEALRPPGNDEVLLRWNACARLLMRHPQAALTSAASFHPYSDS